jgi:N6-L-threonylcarbamoyladenine synthase
MVRDMNILGIETSCDETSVALLEASSAGLRLRVHKIASQIKIHAHYGGVVPEVAARQHMEAMFPMLDACIGRTRMKSIDLIAVTNGPGLVTSLMVGVETAKTLSYAFEKPLIGINHVEAHIYANWLSHRELVRTPKKFFPSLACIVSGGHTFLVLMKGHGTYRLLGQTLDDAAGESFDKVAKMLDLGYPGGPIISKLAQRGDPDTIAFPRPLLRADTYDFSFSGLKTAVLYHLQDRKHISKKEIPDIAASFQQAVVDVLIGKTERGIRAFKPRSLMLAGGVAANISLRETMIALGTKYAVPVFVPNQEFTGDNAAMIAATAYYRRRKASRTAWKKLTFDARARFL